MGTNPKVCFLGGMGGRSLVISQSRKVGFLKKFTELFFWRCGMGGGWRKGVDFLFFFCDIVI
jgi:hypothetical protein